VIRGRPSGLLQFPAGEAVKKIAQNHQNPPFSRFKVMQGYRCWYH